MSVYDKEYTNCIVIIRAIKTDTFIAKTTVAEYRRAEMTITVCENNFSLEGLSHVSLEIFKGDTVYKFMGTVRVMKFPPLRRISLFKGCIIPDRRTKRFPVKTTASIQELIFDQASGDIEKLVPSIPVLLLNVSTNGFLLRTSSDFLSVDLCFKLELMIDQKSTLINATVVRVADVGKENEREYGCRINYIY